MINRSNNSTPELDRSDVEHLVKPQGQYSDNETLKNQDTEFLDDMGYAKNLKDSFVAHLGKVCSVSIDL
jgi:hypothetical protein